jgi:hypothetical protein
MTNYLSPLLNLLLIVGFIIDRIFRLRSINEYKEAKNAQIAVLKQQLESEISNNDIRITEMHQKRYESLKVLLDEKELELDNKQQALLEMRVALQRDIEKTELLNMLIKEINKGEKAKINVDLKRKMFLQQLKS